jgi:hypothetical protein
MGLSTCRVIVATAASLGLAGCVPLVNAYVIVATPHRDAPPEMMALCPSEELRIYARAENVSGILLERVYPERAGRAVYGAEVRRALEKGFAFAEAWSDTRDLDDLKLGVGFHRYSVQERGTPGCEVFERWRGKYKGDRKWGENGDGSGWRLCVATQQIDAPIAEYVYREEEGPIAEHPRGQIWRTRRSIVRIATGEVLAETRRHRFAWSDARDHPIGVQTKDCETDLGKLIIPIEQVLVPTNPYRFIPPR